MLDFNINIFRMRSHEKYVTLELLTIMINTPELSFRHWEGSLLFFSWVKKRRRLWICNGIDVCYTRNVIMRLIKKLKN